METSYGKRLKKSSEAADDRISNLPDEVMLHILSFVPTFDSVAICMLSSRWKHLWKHVPTLNFDDTLTPLDCARNSKKVRFANLVNKVWTSHVPKVLEKLSITCRNDDIYDVGKWVSDSIMRDIHSLDLTIHYFISGRVVQLPSNLFTCKTLEVLVLKGLAHNPNIIVNLPAVVCLPKLKNMKLAGLKYQDDHSGNFISSCVSLESLVVKDLGTRNDYIGFHTISSSTLRDVKFRLYQPPSLIGYNPEIFCSALRRLDLNNFDWKPIMIPVNVFTCKTLEQLILRGRFVICALTTICLPNLTFLSLDRVDFGDPVEIGDDEIFSRLISSCTSLKSLAVSKTMEAELNISSSTIKVIDIKLYCESKPGHKLVINAPALKCLKLTNGGYVDYQIEDLVFLEQAHVCIDDSWPVSYYDYCSSFPTKVFQALRHVKNLSIYHNCSNVGVMEHLLPMFNRLTDLDITISGQMGYRFFQDLIKNSIKLENLSFELNVRSMQDHHWMNDPNPVPACLLSSLRCVSITCFKSWEFELALALYLLENCRMMEKMEVCFSPYRKLSKERKIELCNKILNVRRGSETCDVIIIE